MSKTVFSKVMDVSFAFLLLSVLTMSCSAHEAEQIDRNYESAEVYYWKEPDWSSVCRFIPPTFDGYFKNETARKENYDKFILADEDSLNFIAARIKKGNKYIPADDIFIYPRIVILLHRKEVIDTLVSNTYLKIPELKLNSMIFEDSTLSLFLTESVGKHSENWADEIKTYFGNGDFSVVPFYTIH